MARTTHIQIRVSPQEKRDIKENAGGESISAYVRRLAVSDGADFGPRLSDPDPRLGGEKAPESEPKADPTGIERAGLEPTEAEVEKLARQIYNREGVTMPVARRRALERL